MTSKDALEDSWEKLRGLDAYSVDLINDDFESEYKETREIYGQGPVESALAVIESAYRTNLPVELREFLMRFGGCSLGEPATVALPDKCPCGSRAQISPFFSPAPDSKYSIREAMETYRGRIPDHILPIGADAGGNLLLFSLGELDKGQLFYWDHEYRALPRGAF